MDTEKKKEEVQSTEEVNPKAQEEAKPEKKTVKKHKKEDSAEALKKELAEQKDSYLRLCAEYDNYRKRTAKEKDEIYSNAVAATVKSLIPVIDNFERASSAAHEQSDYSSGIDLIYKQFGEYLNSLDIKEIPAKGEVFDPNLHYAVAHCDDESVGENVIVEVLQKGYMKGDKIFRPAMVKVAN